MASTKNALLSYGLVKGRFVKHEPSKQRVSKCCTAAGGNRLRLNIYLLNFKFPDCVTYIV